jgi:fused signal recognition particle receptor
MAKILQKWANGLERTRKTTFGHIAQLLGTSEINNQTWEDLEALLIQADLGVETTQLILEAMKFQTREGGWVRADQLKSALFSELYSQLPEPPEYHINRFGPTVVLVVGVNGSGKTTSAAKLGNLFQEQGKRVLLVAADTYRAAGIEQLQSWGERLGLRVTAGNPGGDPGAVAFDAIHSAVSRKDDIVLIDTAGRLHTRYNLMEELKKVHRVASKALQGAPHAVWLVMDATTGQNAIQQARAFKEAVNVTGIILAKLDSSARGGMAFAIQRELDLPILFAGLGEGPSDLSSFDREQFIESILADF